MSRVDLLDDFGEDTNHERKDLSFEIFDAKCHAVEDQGIEGWKEVTRFLLDSHPSTLHFFMSQMRMLIGKKRWRYRKKKTSRK